VIASGDRPHVREDLTIVELDGEAVVYDGVTGELHHLNPSATIVLSMCDGARTISAMAEAVSDAFDVALDDVTPQVSSVVERFAEAGLLADD